MEACGSSGRGMWHARDKITLLLDMREGNRREIPKRTERFLTKV